MKKWHLTGFAMVLMALFSLHVSVPCSAQPSKVVVNQWNIPLINAWTGPATGYGLLCDWFQEQAVKEINAKGGIAGKPIVVEKCDEAMDPTRAASCIKKAATDNLVAIGPMTSLSARVAVPIAKSSEILCVLIQIGLEMIQDARPWAVSFARANKFRAEYDMNAWIDRNPGIKKAVLLGLPTVAQWVELGRYQKEALEKRGVEVLDSIDVAQGAVDISSIIVRALKNKPDGIVTRLMSADTVRVVRELQKRGFTNNNHIFIHASADSPELYTMAAEANNVLDGVYMGAFTAITQVPEAQKLLEGLKNLKGQEKASKLMWGEGYYVATYMVKDAIEKTGVTGDPAKLKEERIKIKDYINSLKNFNSILWGPISVQEDGGFTIPLYLTQIRDNKSITVTSTSGR